MIDARIVGILKPEESNQQKPQISPPPLSKINSYPLLVSRLTLTESSGPSVVEIRKDQDIKR